MTDPVDLIKNHQPRDNDDKAAFLGDFIVKLKPIRMIVSKKDQTPWIILEGEVIRVVVSKEGNQAVAGDEWATLYNASDPSQMTRFDNDCKTIGIELDKTSQSAFEASFANAENKNAYVRGWQYERRDGGGKMQSFAIKSKKLITPEMEIPELPF